MVHPVMQGNIPVRQKNSQASRMSSTHTSAAQNPAPQNFAQQTLNRQLTLWIDEDTANIAAGVAKHIDRSLSWYMRRALREQLFRDGVLKPNNS